MEKKKALFEECGFEECNTYSVQENPGVLMVVFLHREMPLTAIITEHPLAGIWSEIDAQYKNGDGLTVTNSEMGDLFEQMPGQEKIYLRGKDEKALFKSAQKKLKRQEAVVITAGNFQEIFEEAYKREMQWRANKGYSEKEIRNVAKYSGQEANDDSIRSTVKIMNKDYSLPCADSKECPYKKQGIFDEIMESMPEVDANDARQCPDNHRLCIDFSGQVEIPESEISDPVSIENTASMITQNPIKPIDITAENGDMKTAIKKAQSSLEKFFQRTRLGIKEEKDFMVRVRIQKDGDRDYFWVKDLTIGEKQLSGTTIYESPLFPDIKMGDVLRFTHDQITDWVYRSGKFWEGHFTGAVLLKRMEKATETIQKAAESLE